METQVKALTILLSALRGRFVCANSAFSQQISTFYGPSVQAMETRLGARQRRRPPTVHRGSTHAPRLQRPVASEDEASACSELRLGCHPETPVIEPCLNSSGNVSADNHKSGRAHRRTGTRSADTGKRPLNLCIDDETYERLTVHRRLDHAGVSLRGNVLGQFQEREGPVHARRLEPQGPRNRDRESADRT